MLELPILVAIDSNRSDQELVMRVPIPKMIDLRPVILLPDCAPVIDFIAFWAISIQYLITLFAFRDQFEAPVINDESATLGDLVSINGTLFRIFF